MNFKKLIFGHRDEHSIIPTISESDELEQLREFKRLCLIFFKKSGLIYMCPDILYKLTKHELEEVMVRIDPLNNETQWTIMRYYRLACEQKKEAE